MMVRFSGNGDGYTFRQILQFHAILIALSCVGCASRDAFQRMGLAKAETAPANVAAASEDLVATEKPPAPEIVEDVQSSIALALDDDRVERFAEPMQVMPVSLESSSMETPRADVPKRKINPIVDLKSSAEFPTLVSQTEGPVLLDFHASWCGPCRRQSGELKEVSPIATKNNARIVKIDVDAHPEIASRFDVTSLPTLVVLRDGEVAHRKKGFTPADELASLIQR